MHYRHILTFDDNAEISGIHLVDGKLAVRVRSGSAQKPVVEVSNNYLYPLYCSSLDGEHWRISAGGVVKAVRRNIWEIIDRINRDGVYAPDGFSRDEIHRVQHRINAMLESIGLKYRIIYDGSALKPEYIDRQSEI